MRKVVILRNVLTKSIRWIPFLNFINRRVNATVCKFLDHDSVTTCAQTGTDVLRRGILVSV